MTLQELKTELDTLKVPYTLQGESNRFELWIKNYRLAFNENECDKAWSLITQVINPAAINFTKSVK